MPFGRNPGKQKMKRNTLRFIIILATLCIIGIALTQIYWVRRAFDLKEEALNRELNTALFNVAQQIFEINKVPSPVVNPVKQLSTNYFVVMVNSEIDVGLLEFLLRSEFEKRNLSFDFEYGIYNCDSEQMVYGNYIAMEKKSKEQKGSLPKWRDETYYFAVQFPTREAHLLNQMGIWSFSTLVLMLVIVFFCYTLFVIFKQRRLSEIQKDFISNMTHEFRTPISTIAISSEVLTNPQITNHPERLLNYATIIQKENNRLRQQVDRVLQVARLDEEDIGLKMEQLDTETIVNESLSNFTHVAKEKGGHLTVINEATNQHVIGDKLHLANMVNNLLDNAIKYCQRKPVITIKLLNSTMEIPRRGLKRFWDLFGKANVPCVQISVRDNGIGISPENQKRIFQQFYRVPTGNIHDAKGFGIGLFYVKLIVEAHGGAISLQSRADEGTQFILSIPTV
jgi:two-component system, OmpR family, phosphate regulon sensor histidine kinase PhoR